MQKRHYVITLVHGTFAQDAPWTLPNSFLRRTIASKLGQQSVAFKRFVWDGSNDHPTRLLGGERLRDQLLRQMVAKPKSRHFIIAHSHGGNVAAYALRDESLRNRLSGLVTMGTPFISCRPRNIKVAFDSLRWVAVVLLAFPLLIIPPVFEDEFARRVLHDSNVLVNHIYLVVTNFLGWIASLIWAYQLIHRPMRRWAERRQHTTRRTLEFIPFAHPPVLCATVAGDEAGMLLSAQRQTSNLPAVLFGAMVELARRVAPPLLVLWISATFVETIWNLQKIDHTILIVGTYTLKFVNLLVLLQIPMVVVPLLVRSHRWGFGGESITDNWFCDITASAVPPAQPCRTVIVPAPHLKRGQGWSHCCFYDDEQFLESACTWMQNHG